MFNKKKSFNKIWHRFVGKISIWALIASMSGAGVSAVNIQYNHNMGII